MVDQPIGVAGQGGLFARLAKTVLERSVAAEPTDHLSDEQGDPAGSGSGNSRNCYGPAPPSEHRTSGDGRHP
jgi:putative transposase